MRTNSIRRHPVLAVLTAFLAVAVLGTDVWLLSQRNRTTTVDLTEALDRFRTGVATAPASPASTTPAGEAVIVPAAETASVSTSAPGAAPAPRPTTPAGVPTVDVPARAPAEAQAPAPQRPLEGVYTYRTTGGEEISTAGASHRYPDRTFASVRHGEGCQWEIESDVIEEHHDHRLMCSDGTQVLQHSQRREVEFFGQRDGFTATCEPPAVLEQAGEPAGAVTEATCSGEGITSSLVRTFIGAETISIGGQPVTVHHIHVRGDFTGRATGYAEEDLWLIPGTGMTARWKRMVDTKADAAFGAQVRYQEDVDFVLESLDPQV